MIYHKMDLFLSRNNYVNNNMAWNRNKALSQSFSKLIAIKNGFSGHYISTQPEADLILIFVQNLQSFMFTGL